MRIAAPAGVRSATRVLAAALLSALSGWAVVAGFCLVGWLSVTQIPLRVTLHLASQGWLLAHFVPVGLPGARLSIAPLGLTAILVLIGSGLCGWIVPHAGAPAGTSAAAAAPPALRLRWILIGYVAGYALLVMVLAVLSEGSAALLPALLGGAGVAAVSGLVGLARSWPRRPGFVDSWAALGWPLAAVRGIGAGVLTMLAAGALVLMLALIGSRERVSALYLALDPDPAGGVLLTLGQLAWLPNLALWGAAWVSGAGLGLGQATLVSPAANTVGLLPSIPVLAAVPPAGATPGAMMLWLTVGLLAGGLAAHCLLARLERRSLRVDLAAVQGALIGILSGLALTGVVALSGGDLAPVRLVGLGPRIGVMAVMAPTVLGIGGLLTGAWAGVSAWRARRPPQA